MEAADDADLTFYEEEPEEEEDDEDAEEEGEDAEEEEARPRPILQPKDDPDLSSSGRHMQALLADVVARREADAFYMHDPAAAAANDDRAIEALSAATTDILLNPWTLHQMRKIMQPKIADATKRLTSTTTPSTPRIADVRRIAFWTRCRREVYDPWFLRVFAATEFGLGPLRALEASIPDKLQHQAYRACYLMLYRLVAAPNFVHHDHLLNMQQQLQAMQAKLNLIPADTDSSEPSECLHQVNSMLEFVTPSLQEAQARRTRDPHIQLLAFEHEFRLSTKADTSSRWLDCAHPPIIEMAATLAELTDPNQAGPASLPDRVPENYTIAMMIPLDERLRTMLAELNGMLLRPRAAAAPLKARRSMWMVAHIELEDLLLRLNAVMRLRQEWRAERRQALALAWLPVRNDQQAPPVAAMDEELMRSIERLSCTGWHPPP